jgi:hypothetical protein
LSVYGNVNIAVSSSEDTSQAADLTSHKNFVLTSQKSLDDLVTEIFFFWAPKELVNFEGKL